jgi:hypothetical protein
VNVAGGIGSDYAVGSDHCDIKQGSKVMVISSGTLLLIVILVLLVGGLPAWPHSKSWGYGPTGMLSTVLVILLVMMLMGRL